MSAISYPTHAGFSFGSFFLNLLRRVFYAASGFGLALLLFVLGLYLGGGLLEPPKPKQENSILISDTIILEPEKKPIEVQLDADIPRMDIDMDTTIEIETPPLNIQYTINPRITVGVAVPAPPAMRAEVSNTIYGVHQLETQPRASHVPPPQYPRNARRLNRSGEVIVLVTLDKGGSIVKARLAPGADNEMFGPAALEAVKKWRFTPGKIGGKAVMCEVEIPMEFNMSR